MPEKFFKPVVHVLLLTRKLITQCHATVFLRALNLVSLNHRRVTELMDLQPSIQTKFEEIKQGSLNIKISKKGFQMLDEN